MKSIITFYFFVSTAAIQFGCRANQSSEHSAIEQPAETSDTDLKSLTVFLVRHAEKADNSEDPELTESGKARAAELAKTLRSANIEYVHSSDFIRTRETAAPTAETFGLMTEIYDHKDLETLALKIKDQGGIHLIVGHSNSTPAMTGLLGGDPGSKINEQSEYDRLYIVSISPDGNVNSILMRYGHPFSYNEDSESQG